MELEVPRFQLENRMSKRGVVGAHDSSKNHTHEELELVPSCRRPSNNFVPNGLRWRTQRLSHPDPTVGPPT